jgi:hypothetical protein
LTKKAAAGEMGFVIERMQNGKYSWLTHELTIRKQTVFRRVRKMAASDY